jgi:hypothetical protein
MVRSRHCTLLLFDLLLHHLPVLLLLYGGHYCEPPRLGGALIALAIASVYICLNDPLERYGLTECEMWTILLVYGGMILVWYTSTIHVK